MEAPLDVWAETDSLHDPTVRAGVLAMSAAVMASKAVVADAVAPFWLSQLVQYATGSDPLCSGFATLNATAFASCVSSFLQQSSFKYQTEHVQFARCAVVTISELNHDVSPYYRGGWCRGHVAAARFRLVLAPISGTKPAFTL